MAGNPAFITTVQWTYKGNTIYVIHGIAASMIAADIRSQGFVLKVFDATLEKILA